METKYYDYAVSEGLIDSGWRIDEAEEVAEFCNIGDRVHQLVKDLEHPFFKDMTPAQQAEFVFALGAEVLEDEKSRKWHFTGVIIQRVLKRSGIEVE